MSAVILIFTYDMNSIWVKLLFIFSSSIYPATIVGFITSRRLNKELKIIFYFTIISSIIGGLMAYLNINGINNTLYYNIFTLLEYIFLTTAIWVNQKINIYKWFGIIGTIILTTLFAITLHEKEIVYNNTLRLTEAALLIIISIIYLTRIFGEHFMEYVKDPFKYVIIGMFTYFSSSILILSAGNQTQLFTHEQFIILFCINAFFYSIMVLLITISFIKCYRR